MTINAVLQKPYNNGPPRSGVLNYLQAGSPLTKNSTTSRNLLGNSELMKELTSTKWPDWSAPAVRYVGQRISLPISRL